MSIAMVVASIGSQWLPGTQRARKSQPDGGRVFQGPRSTVMWSIATDDDFWPGRSSHRELVSMISGKR